MEDKTFVNDIKKVINEFMIKGKVDLIEKEESGLINKSYIITTDDKSKYLLQKINQNVFKDPYKVMKNIEYITKHLKKKRVMTLVLVPLRTKENSYCYQEDNNYYRCYEYINDSYSISKINNEKQAYQLGKIIGEFQIALSDLDVKHLSSTIDNFHNIEVYYSHLLKTIKTIELLNLDQTRLNKVYKELNYIINNENTWINLRKAIDNGIIPLRVVHNDTKINNVLFDNSTQSPRCLVDLDTVMPGISLFDYGDAVRVGCATKEEDEQNTELIDIDLTLLENFTKGYLKEANSFLNVYEKEHMYDFIAMITLECAIRFLNDFLNNDIYFKTDYPLHNLIRAKAQIKLHKVINKKALQIKEIINKCLV